MPTPDEVRRALHVLLNQVPPTMQATRAIIIGAARLTSVDGEDGEVDIEKLTKLVNGLRATLLVSVIELEDRFEKLAGRPGIPTDMLEAILDEFGVGGP